MASTIASLLIAVGVDARGIDSGLAAAEARVGGFGAKVAKSGAALSLGLSVPLIAVGAAALKSALTVDEAYDTIQAGTGATGKELQGLKDSFGDVAKSTPADMGKVADSVTQLNQRLGLTGPVLTKLSRQVLEAGRMGGADVNIKNVTSAFSAFDVKGRETTKGMDDLFQVSQATGVGINDLSAIMAKQGGVLSQLGFNFKDAASFIGVMDKAGVNSRAVTSAMSSGLVKLAKDGEKPVDAFKRVGSEIQGFVDKGNDAKALDLASKVFGTRGAGQFVAALKSGKVNLDDISKSAGLSGQSILGVADKTKDFPELWQQFKNKATLALAPLGAVLLPKISSALTTMGDWLTKAVAWWDGLGSGAKKGIGIAVLALAALGPALMIVGAAIALITSPITLIVIGIGALVAAFVLAYKNSETFRDTVNGAITSVVGFVQGTLIPAVKAIWDTFMQYLPQITAIATSVFSAVFTTVKLYLGFVKAYITTVVSVVRALWNTFGETILETIQRVFPALVQIVKGALNVIQGVIRTVTSLIKGDWSGVWNGIQQILSGVWSILGGIVKAGVGLLLGAVKGFGDLLHAAWKGIWNAAKDAVSNAWNGIKDAAVKGAGKLLSFVGSIPARIMHALGDLGALLLNAGAELIGGFVQGIKNKIGDVKDALGSLTNSLTSWKGPPAKDKVLLTPSGHMVMDGFTKGILDRIPAVRSAAGEVTDETEAAFRAKAKERAAALHAIGKMLGKNFAEGVDGSREDVLSSFGSLLEQVKVLNDKQLTAMVVGTRNRLSQLGAEWDKAHADLVKAKDKLKALVDEANSYAAQVQQSIASSGDVSSFSGVVDENGQAMAVTFSDIESGMESAVSQARAFREALAQLVKLGLNKNSLADLVAKGPAEGLAAAQAILAGGEAAVQRVNQLYKQISTLGAQVAAIARSSMYDAGVKSAQGLVDGLASAEDDIAKQMRKIARTMIREIKKELGINSPAKELVPIGTYSGLGVIKGLDGIRPKVAAAAARMTDSAMFDPTPGQAYAVARMTSVDAGTSAAPSPGAGTGGVAQLAQLLALLIELLEKQQRLIEVLEGLPAEYRLADRQNLTGRSPR